MLNMLKELFRKKGKSISSHPHPDCDFPETFEYKGLFIRVAPGGDNDDVVKHNVRYFNQKTAMWRSQPPVVKVVPRRPCREMKKNWSENRVDAKIIRI